MRFSGKIISKNTIKSIIILFVSYILVSCSNRSNHNDSRNDADFGNFLTIDMRMDNNFFDSILNQLPSPEYVVLQETDSLMFAEISKIVAQNNKLFVLDSWGARTVLSFDKNGKPLVQFGRVGQGPGEYFRPEDLWVNDSIVFILDAVQKKVIRYKENGDFLSETSIPFFADALAVLPDNRYIFNIMPEGNGEPQICIFDPIKDDYKYLINSKKGYVGGLSTRNVFRQTKNGVSFYKSPLDSLYYIDKEGEINGGLVFNFGSKGLSETAKLDFLTASENNETNNQSYVVDSPIQLSDNIFYFSVYENDVRYNCLFDCSNNKFGGARFASKGNPFLLSLLSTSDECWNHYGFTKLEFIEKLDEKYQLPDSVRNLLNGNAYVIVKYRF